MRTTLDIADDVLLAAQELARRERKLPMFQILNDSPWIEPRVVGSPEDALASVGGET